MAVILALMIFKYYVSFLNIVMYNFNLETERLHQNTTRLINMLKISVLEIIVGLESQL